MIQDIFPMHLSNEYHKKVPQADSFLMIFKDNYILAKNDGQVCYLTYKELSEICRWMGKEIPVCVYLFSIGRIEYIQLSILCSDDDCYGAAMEKCMGGSRYAFLLCADCSS